jgi:hypothetical protein
MEFAFPVICCCMGYASEGDKVVSWRGQKGHRIALEVWRLAPLYLMWCIWRERNTRSFEDSEIAMLELKKILFQSLYTWIVAYNSLPIFFKKKQYFAHF